MNLIKSTTVIFLSCLGVWVNINHHRGADEHMAAHRISEGQGQQIHELMKLLKINVCQRFVNSRQRCQLFCVVFLEWKVRCNTKMLFHCTYYYCCCFCNSFFKSHRKQKSLNLTFSGWKDPCVGFKPSQFKRSQGSQVGPILASPYAATIKQHFLIKDHWSVRHI